MFGRFLFRNSDVSRNLRILTYLCNTEGASMPVAVALDKSQVSAALRRWKRQGHNFDPSNESHIAAYILARENLDRPRAEYVLSIIASQEAVHRTSAAMQTDFWLVPRGNIDVSDGDIKRWITNEAHLRSNFDVPKDLDLGDVVCLSWDSVVPFLFFWMLAA